MMRGDQLFPRELAFMGFQKADELLMAMTMDVAAHHRAVEHVERGEQGRRAVSLVVMGHGPGVALLQRQPRLGAIERLNLALFVDGQNDSVRGRIDIEPPTTSRHLSTKRGSLESFNPDGHCAAGGRGRAEMR